MKTASIGILQDNGDFEILATLNNNNDHISPDAFGALVLQLCTQLTAETGQQARALHRQDVPDFVTL